MAETNENGNRNDGGEARILKQGFPVPTDIIGFIIGKTQISTFHACWTFETRNTENLRNI